MTKPYSTEAAFTRPEDISKVTSKQLQEYLKKETIELNHTHERRWKSFKHWMKIVLFFIIMPIAVVILLMTWFVSFLYINWHNPQAIMTKSGFFLSYVFTALLSAAITHYIEKR